MSARCLPSGDTRVGVGVGVGVGDTRVGDTRVGDTRVGGGIGGGDTRFGVGDGGNGKIGNGTAVANERGDCSTKRDGPEGAVLRLTWKLADAPDNEGVRGGTGAVGACRQQ